MDNLTEPDWLVDRGERGTVMSIFGSPLKSGKSFISNCYGLYVSSEKIFMDSIQNHLLFYI